MKNYITIDGGTTNTRISLIKDGRAVETIKLSLGARSGIDNNDALKTAIADAIDTLLKKSNGIEIEKILASGMITSEFGLYNLPHISAPSGIDELHNAMCEVRIDDISEIPFVFIPGIKVSDGELSHSDMMRGEETEFIGLSAELGGEKSCMYILPGSHSKLIRVDKNGRVFDFSTTLTGEMIAALSQGTILKDAVDLSQSETDNEYLIKGFEYCSMHGINNALFKVRILKNMFGASPKQTYSFFLGVVLNAEIITAAKSDEDRIIIGGKKQIKDAMCTLLKHVCGGKKEVIAASAEAVERSTSLGMIKIYEQACRLTDPEHD